ncbi:MAG: translocation/assembly module TamB domain-containing protein [Alloprevotella sp.]|nr:translocation/assembly module TamB domain-containing protein [Alloprevotella sp.]
MAIYLALLALFNVPASRRFIAREAATLLSQHVGSRVSIGDVHVSLLNRVVLDSVFVADCQGRPMIEAGRLAAKIEWMPLLHDQIRLNSVSLLDATLHASKAKADSAANFQFFLDAFNGSDDEPSKPVDLRIGSLVLRRCNIFYDEHYAEATPGVFNASHVGINGLNASVSLKQLTPDSINVRVRSLSFREQSGIDVRSLRFNLAAGSKMARLEGFDLRLPRTSLSLPSTDFRYDGSPDASLLQRLRFGTQLDNASFAPADIAAFVPAVKGIDNVFRCSAALTKGIGHLRLEHLRLSEEHGGLNLDADVQLGMREGRVDNLQATLRDLAVRRSFYAAFVPQVTHEPLPEPLPQLGDVRVKGTLQLRSPFDGLARLQGSFNGDVFTDAGNLKSDLTYAASRLSGSLSADHLRLAQLAGSQDLPADITFSARGMAEGLGTASPAFSVDASVASVEYAGRTFRDIGLRGEYRNRLVTSDVLVRDPSLNVEARFSGRADAGTLRDIVLSGTVRDFTPAVLGLSGKYAANTYGGDIQLSLSELPRGTLPDAEVRLHNFSMRDAEAALLLDSIFFRSQPSEDGKCIDFQSDFLTLHLDGPSDIERLKNAAQGILARALPDFVPSPLQEAAGNWAFDATLLDAAPLNEFLGTKLSLAAPLHVEGNLRGDGLRSRLVASSADIAYDGIALRDASVVLQAEGDNLSAIVNGARGELVLSLSSHSEDGKLVTELGWDGFKAFPLHGSLHTLTSCRRDGDAADYLIRILPSEVAVGDTLWNVSAGTLAYADKTLDIRGLSLQHEDQGLTLDGRFSSNPADSLVATLHKMDVEYILGLVNFDAVDFAGQASGRLSLSQKFGYPLVNADLRIPHFLFNNGPMGELHLLGGFNGQAKRIDLDGDMRDAALGNRTTAKGYVSLAEDAIELDIQSQRTNLQCLRRYLKGIMDDLDGTATGHLRLFGPLKKLDFEGSERITAEALLPYTGVRYQVTDGRVDVTPGTFSFDSLHISDYAKGTGIASGYLQHTHLKNLTYAFDATASNLLVYNKARSADMPFYATAYGSGDIIFSGRPGSFDAEINMRPERGTTFTYVVDMPEGVGDASMVTFHDPAKEAAALADTLAAAIAPQASGSSSDIRLSMLFDVNPNATLRVIMDDKSGDAIALHGSGLLRASYYNKGNFHLYGNYHIADGNYRMSIQDVIRKDFRFSEGGNIVFGGDPFEGDLDMQGVYTVNSASLSDLGIGTAFSQNSVRVNCLLNFTGKVKDPKVTFGLDLPTVNAEEKQMLLGVISTEEEMTTQVLYLLGIGRFYTNSGMQSDAGLTAGAQSSAAMKSFLSSTLSSQLNQIISDAVGSSNWTFGANVSTGSVGTNDMEIEGLLSGRLLNNRLLVNGNIGYRDNTYYNTNFIGDFDVRYLLTPGGTVSLKAYSETNDRYFSKSALTTQGAGIQLRRDFSNLRDLFSGRKKMQKQQQTVNGKSSNGK